MLRLITKAGSHPWLLFLLSPCLHCPVGGIGAASPLAPLTSCEALFPRASKTLRSYTVALLCRRVRLGHPPLGCSHRKQYRCEAPVKKGLSVRRLMPTTHLELVTIVHLRLAVPALRARVRIDRVSKNSRKLDPDCRRSL